MKKVFAIIMVMVTLIAGACADEYALPEHDEGYAMLHVWASRYGYEKWFNGEMVNGAKTGAGMLSAEYFEKETGRECTIETYVDTMKEYYDYIDTLEVREVGQIEGHPVYVVTGTTSEEMIDGYQKVSMLFMICK